MTRNEKLETWHVDEITGSGGDRLDLNSSYSISYWVTVGKLTSLCFSFLFLFCKTEIIIVSISKVVVRLILKHKLMNEII